MRRSLTQPGQLRSKFGLLSVDTEPDGPSWVPCVYILAFGNLGKVRLERAGVVGTRIDVDLHVRSGGDTDGLVTSLELVAADVAACHIANEAVVLPILGLADSTPSRRTIDDRQCV